MLNNVRHSMILSPCSFPTSDWPSAWPGGGIFLITTWFYCRCCCCYCYHYY